MLCQRLVPYFESVLLSVAIDYFVISCVSAGGASLAPFLHNQCDTMQGKQGIGTVCK